MVENVFIDRKKVIKNTVENKQEEYINSRLSLKIQELFKLNEIMNFDMKIYIFGILWTKIFSRKKDINKQMFLEIIMDEFFSLKEKPKDENEKSRIMLALDIHFPLTVLKEELKENN